MPNFSANAPLDFIITDGDTSTKVKRQATTCLFTVVRHIDLSWNTLEPSLVLMHQKLTDLGWVFYNGEIHIVEPETEESKHHVK